MPIELNQIFNGLVDAEEDAVLYDFIVNANVMTKPCGITVTAADKLHVSDGSGIACGRAFTILDDSITVALAPTGSLQGRLIAEINMTNSETPARFVTQLSATLPALIQENILDTGSIFQMPLCTYTVGTTAISNLKDVQPRGRNIMYKSEYDKDGDGAVDKAKNADYATNATNATNAANATNAGFATTAGNANALGGKAAASWQSEISTSAGDIVALSDAVQGAQIDIEMLTGRVKKIEEWIAQH